MAAAFVATVAATQAVQVALRLGGMPLVQGSHSEDSSNFKLKGLRADVKELKAEVAAIHAEVSANHAEMRANHEELLSKLSRRWFS